MQENIRDKMYSFRLNSQIRCTLYMYALSHTHTHTHKALGNEFTNTNYKTKQDRLQILMRMCTSKRPGSSLITRISVHWLTVVYSNFFGWEGSPVAMPASITSALTATFIDCCIEREEDHHCLTLHAYIIHVTCTCRLTHQHTRPLLCFQISLPPPSPPLSQPVKQTTGCHTHTAHWQMSCKLLTVNRDTLQLGVNSHICSDL